MFEPKNILVTGGAGFIGSNFIRYLFAETPFAGRVINVDRLTYAGNLENLADIAEKHGDSRYFFVQADICEADKMAEVFDRFAVDCLVHFAAESHVDRAILGPGEFIRTNIDGTFTLLETARECWAGRRAVLFHYISTDEVYGSLGKTGYFYERTPYRPRSPYSASKASAALLVKAYFHTYGLPVTLSNCSNNYGPFQFPEKLIPLTITQAMAKQPLPVYGDGLNVRDWIFVADHCAAVWTIICRGRRGEEYNVGGNAEKPNIDVVRSICGQLEKWYPLAQNRAAGQNPGSISAYSDLITYVKDRPGHDWRYALNCDKIRTELGFTPAVDFGRGLEETVRWYIARQDWLENVRSGEYQGWLQKNYRGRS